MTTDSRQGFNAATGSLSEVGTILISAPLPENEAARLEALRECKILDTAPEPTFDDITRIAAHICGTPIALVSLIDTDRQWFKSKVGINATQTPRSVAFCAHTIGQSDVLIVPDTLSDLRFATNPLVTADPHIRFYAGVPLITAEGYALGTLCVIDHVPRELTPEQVEALQILGRQVVRQIELRRNIAELQRTAVERGEVQKENERFFNQIAAEFGLALAILVAIGVVSYCIMTGLIKSSNLNFFILAAVYYFIARLIAERQRQEALQQANEKLTSWVNELEQRNREIALLSEMSDVLQACLTVEEAKIAIAQFVQALFPHTSGGIFLISASNNLVERVATWGSPPFASEKLFTPHECWALRRGRAHFVGDTHSVLLCQHLHQNPSPAESLCVPMMAQGEALGVLYLSSLELGRLTQTKQQLATTVSENIALSLANIKLRETLQHQSIRDPLTGLFNRRYMEESLERELHRCNRKQQPLSIIMLDVDHFKRFNDTFGHEAGDTVLRELGQFLQTHVRGSDIACRYGGEEMTLILPEASLDVTCKRAEQLREGIKHLNVQHRHQPLGAITISVGVASFPKHGLTGEAVLQAADAALYRAKKEGRDAVRLAP